MTWESFKEELIEAGYQVVVEVDSGYTEVSCEKDGIKISSKIPVTVIQRCKFDMVENTLRIQKNDIDLAICERSD